MTDLKASLQLAIDASGAKAGAQEAGAAMAKVKQSMEEARNAMVGVREVSAEMRQNFNQSMATVNQTAVTFDAHSRNVNAAKTAVDSLAVTVNKTANVFDDQTTAVLKTTEAMKQAAEAAKNIQAPNAASGSTSFGVGATETAQALNTLTSAVDVQAKVVTGASKSMGEYGKLIKATTSVLDAASLVATGSSLAFTKVGRAVGQAATSVRLISMVSGPVGWGIAGLGLGLGAYELLADKLFGIKEAAAEANKEVTSLASSLEAWDRYSATMRRGYERGDTDLQASALRGFITDLESFAIDAYKSANKGTQVNAETLKNLGVFVTQEDFPADQRESILRGAELRAQKAAELLRPGFRDQQYLDQLLQEAIQQVIDELETVPPEAAVSAIERDISYFQDSLKDVLGKQPGPPTFYGQAVYGVTPEMLSAMQNYGKAVGDAMQQVQGMEMALGEENEALRLVAQGREQDLDVLRAQQIMRRVGVELTEQETENLRRQAKEREDLIRIIEIQDAIAGSLANSFTEAFATIGAQGATLRDTLRSILQGIQSDMLNVFVRSPLQRFFATSLGGFFGGGGGTPLPAGFAGPPAPAGFNAMGGVFSGGSKLTAFAGGGIFYGPHVFPMANGGVGLLGEAGPEAVVPLAPTRSGKLGIAMADGGKGRGGTYVNMTVVTRDADSFRRNSRQISRDMHDAIGRQGRNV